MKQSKFTGAIALTVAQAIVLFLGFIIHPLIGRMLGKAEYGIFGVVLSFQTIFGIILTLGVPSAVSKFVAQNTQYARSILAQALKIQIGVGLCISLIVVLLSPIASSLLHDNSLTKYFIFIAGVIFLQGLYPIFVQFLSGMHRFNKQALLTSSYAIAKVLGAVSLIYLFRLYGALSSFAVGGIIAAFLGWYITRNIGGTKPYTIPLKSFFAFAGTYAVILLGLQILMSQDLFMVKAILKDDALAGDYNAAVNLSRIPYMLLQGMAFVLLPSVSALTRPGASHDSAAIFIRDALRYLIALIVPTVVLASATSKGFVTFFYRVGYESAAPIFTILIVGLGALSFYLLLANIVAGAGKPKIALYITGLMIGISAILGYFLIPQYELRGAAWQTTIAALIGLTALAIYTFRTFQIPYPIKSTIHILIATSIMVLPTYFWKASSLMLPIQYAVLGVIYIAVLWILGEINEQDTALLRSLKKSSRTL
ncbi:MAG: oligosaccharide flippase family protein [bacterium]|nr:oligosaccharide flippase family protein [bacterium]